MSSPGPSTDDEVPPFWRALGRPGLVDVHVHFMPDRVLRKVWAHFDAVDWPITYRTGEEARLAHLRRLGVRAFPSLVYAHKPGMAEWLNRWAAAFADRIPDCLRTATFFAEPSADRYVAEALEDGARIFKVHFGVGAYDPRHDWLRPVWRRLAASATPVVAHVGSGPEPGPFTGPEVFAEVLAVHPDLVAIVAHMGTTEYAAFWELALRYPNVRLDTTMAFTDFMQRLSPYPTELLAHVAEHPERILFGSDYPNIPYRYAHQLEALAGLGFGDDWLRAVCWDNGARLFGLPTGQTASRKASSTSG